jgi:hypothetical protein
MSIVFTPIEIRVHTSHVAVRQTSLEREADAYLVAIRVYLKDYDRTVDCRVRVPDAVHASASGGEEDPLRIAQALSAWLADELPEEGECLEIRRTGFPGGFDGPIVVARTKAPRNASLSRATPQAHGIAPSLWRWLRATRA